jgi:di/tripeptidase
MRSGDQHKLDELDAVLKASVLQALKEENAGRTGGPELSVDIKRVGTRPAAAGDANIPLVQRSVAATRAFDIDPELRISSTDANLPISKGIPAVTMSRGGKGGQAHSPDEWWVNGDGHIGIQIALLTLLLEAGCANCTTDK